MSHTHAVIDAYINQTLMRLRQYNALILTDLHHEVSQSYKENKQHVKHAHHAANCSGLFDLTH